MPFSGGGGGVLTNHTHDPAIPVDGGSLAANATSFSLTNGSILYSDGANIQELGIGNSGQVLGTAAGTIPTWEAGAASPVMTTDGQIVIYDGGRTALNIGAEDQVLAVSAGGLPNWVAPPTSKYEFIEQFTATASSTFTCTFATPIPRASFVELVLVWRGKWGTGALDFQIATDHEVPIDNGEYSWKSNVLTSSSTFTEGVSQDEYTIGPSTTAAGSQGTILMNLSINELEGAGGDGTNIYVKWWQIGANVVGSWGGGRTYDNTSTITTLDGLYFSNSLGNNIEAGTTLDVYKITS